MSNSSTNAEHYDLEGPTSARLFGIIAPRDTEPTAFTAILEQLIDRVAGAVAAALVDSQGETVDYAGRGDPFEMRIAAAHLQIALRELAVIKFLGEPRWCVIRASQRSFAASALPDGYVLVLLLRPRAAFTISTRALKCCTRALADEAGWTLREMQQSDGVKQRSWFFTQVETDRRGRPTHVGEKRTSVEVIGAVMGLSVRERGFRVRTAEGSELTLVREPRQRWYADEPV
ncbi:MAG: hypothetical protein U0270_30805 [Labilithrix sp.]